MARGGIYRGACAGRAGGSQNYQVMGISLGSVMAVSMLVRQIGLAPITLPGKLSRAGAMPRAAPAPMGRTSSARTCLKA